MKYILLFLLYLLLIFKPSLVFAGDVVINEFLVDPESDQWVELFNKGSSAVDISGWVIDDSGGSQAYTIPSGTTISSGEFKAFSSSYFNLNRSSADTVRLLHNLNEEDSYSYPSGPGTNNTYGRVIDGIGDWGIFASSTKGSTNNASTQQPAPTLQPTVTPTSTKSPTPKPTAKIILTKTPTPTKSPTPTRTPTPIKSGPTSIKVSATFSKTNERSDDSSLTTSEKKSSLQPTSVLGVSTISAETQFPSPTPKKTLVKDANQKKEDMSWIFILIGGSALLVCAILTFFIRRKRFRSEL